jgi:hypothetical protein
MLLLLTHALQDPVSEDIWRQRVDGVCDLLPALRALKHLPLVINILEALSTECVLTGEHLVQVTQLLQADGALQQLRQVHSDHLLIS